MNQTSPKWPFLLQRIALVIFAFLPIGFSFFAQLQYLYGAWGISLLVRTVLLVGILLAPLFLVLVRDDVWHAIETRSYLPLVWAVVLAIAVRLTVLPLLSTNFSSDMQDIHLFATDVVSGHPFANLSRYQGIPWAVHLNMTGLMTSAVYRIFGATPATAKMFMVVLAALTVWLVYLAGRQIAGARVGFIAASLFGTLPSLVCYTGVLSGEHIALLLITLAILFYGRARTSEDHRLLFYAGSYSLCGILIGLIDWFRPGGVILLTALVISEMIYWRRDRVYQHQLIPIGLLIASYLIVSATAVAVSERYFRTDVMSAVQQSGHFILLGLNPAHGGMINNEDRQIAFDAYERYGEDNTAANLYLIQLAIERLKGESVLDLFRSKIELIWSNHGQLFQISLNGSNDHEFVKMLSDIDSLVYFLVTVFIGVNIYASLVNRPQPAVFAMQLFILGFAIWSLILEAQNRYAIITIPYQILLAALGMNEIARLLKSREAASA
jgi:4-amino-4-deoxy-L-arabinose transferase-like glycosyltransferase